jgi:flagellar biosynthesis protein FlhB
MAEAQAQEKTEQATPKRIRDARDKGQVPRSRELNTVLSLMMAGVGSRSSRISIRFWPKICASTATPLSLKRWF